MKFNIYFLIVGILSILFSITHALNGHAAVLPLTEAAAFGIATKTTIFYVWHIITIENLIFGITFLIMAFYKDSAKVKFAAWMIAIIILARWVIIFGTTLLKDINGISNILTDSAAIIIFVGLIILGIRRNDKALFSAIKV
ncbi:MAG: hypothetical protein HF300_07200 [Ignavibacteria bacterium]|jgi:hypothetical protein|nr:hypothetical protein [Ignavibacteria bacterium]MCU7512326.1 hypothetical protein [Ignavibacteria bacterium]